METFKKYWFFLIILLIGVILWCCPRNNSYYSNKDTSIIDSLQSKIDSLSLIKTEVDQRIDTIIQTIEKVHIKYEKERDSIINNTADENYLFFIEYIEQYKSRFDSINNL